ncbi:reversion-inducing cysteine-rich protein with Kazal motifs [Anopheles aquasalis]|uniref:reversion-inducing cysteine-rich protein with Kazal motifs n=1 Tax=Anopheles aquasalis TaxID=42839 RepID=UPI00215ADB47|nr:reversion-inducing cysteine-rich protein with Kazal motifs [Anopheles aquasalis]XP_050097349.1 reversion-inducing cysteine-rich protein with Kazal motifs [Anopheles aquasalis]XP_050097350.1 reversion-inducing cysteine-rich protein with Kazal motifs [Anopheles aquasalis]XP_050097351.1 reversion-inducing cysteine-rich protein with Kazal motifs [Anopheles aquasalis]XP_050097352.1 reversion-inducing cysteine-rich protein with Kazal motifs [Anopheles aquasalis]
MANSVRVATMASCRYQMAIVYWLLVFGLMYRWEPLAYANQHPPQHHPSQQQQQQQHSDGDVATGNDGALFIAGQTPNDGFTCCSEVQGSCKAACENLSLARIAADPSSREAKLVDVRLYCPKQQLAFWHCMNETMAGVQRGAGWPGRICCPLAMSIRCQNVCATGSSQDELRSGCRPSDEQSLYGCLKRQEDGHRCCSSARTAECLQACGEVFRRHQTPSRGLREQVLTACRSNNSNVMQCIKGFIDVTFSRNLKRYVPCCDSSPEPQCRRVCHETLTVGESDTDPYTVEEMIDLLEHRGGCGALMPTEPLWRCFLEADRQRKVTGAGTGVGGHQQQLNSNEVSRINQIGMDSAKQHCCLRAESTRCRRLCSTTYANEWTTNLVDFEQECLTAPEEHELRQCIDEVDEPCELGCDGLSFCSNFNNRPTELFRSCRPQSDMAARTDVQQWRQQGYVPFLGVQLPMRNQTECSYEIWKSIACTLQIKPCTKAHHTNHICRQDCYEVLKNCVDWQRMPEGYTVASLCQQLAPQNGSAPCISMGRFQSTTLVGGAPGGGFTRDPGTEATMLVSPCRGNPCNATQVCVANRDGTYGYRCENGCALGEASSYLVPAGTFVRIPVSVNEKGCLKVCRCGATGRIEKCQPLPCMSYESCALAGKRFAHLSHFYVECNVCSCFAEEITCTKKQCHVPGLTVDRAFTSLPCNCPPHYVPVCGRNGNTYPSACVAKCAGVPEGDIAFGPCRAKNPCDQVDCGPLSVCLPDWNVCLSGMHKPCPQYRCVNLTATNCSTITDVRDTSLGYHATLCALVLEGATFAYQEKYRKHCETSRRRNQVCGVNGVTYRSECHAWSDYSTVDYNGPCQEVGLISPTLEAKCSSIKCPKRKSQNCSPVLPPGACCPVCGTALRIVYSRKQIDRGLYALKGGSTDYLTLKSILRSLEALLQTVECRLSGQLTFENDLYVIVETLVKGPSKLQTQICAQEAERLVTLVRTQSHRITSELNLSALTMASLVSSGSGAHGRGPAHPLLYSSIVLTLALWIYGWSVAIREY